MRATNLQRRGAQTYGRGISPNSFAQRGGNPNLSVHSEHLWNMMEDVELFPEEIYVLLKNEDRNLTGFKKQIERQKYKAGQLIQSLKKEMQFTLEDLKLSVYSQLDRIYTSYMQKYANLKGEIMQVKRLKEQLELAIQSRSVNYNPRSFGQKDNMPRNTNNASIIKSMESNTHDIKRYQMSNYISELQKEKISPLIDLSRELVIMSQYKNGYFQNKEFNTISNNILDNLKANIRDIYDRKYQFIRDIDQICMKESKPILEELNQPLQVQVQSHLPPPTFNNSVGSMGVQSFRPQQQPMAVPVQSTLYRDMSRPQMSRMEETKFIGIAPEQQNITFELAQNVNFIPLNSVKNLAGEIILCALEIGRNTIAVGSKDGIITIYQATSSQKIAQLKGHKASICKLALISHNGKKYLASGSDHGCSSVILWDLSTWTMRMKMQSHRAAVTSIVDLQDNRSIISGSYDKTMNIYDMNNEGRQRFNLPANRASVTAILLNCNGNKLITCGLDNSLNVLQVMRSVNREVDTMFVEREIQNDTMICSIVASVINPDLVFLGTKDGKVKLINIDRGQAYKIYNICTSAVIEMVVIERQSKPNFPIAICWPCNEEVMKIVNTETHNDGQTLRSQQVKGYIEFGCGIGPKCFFMSNGRSLAMLSQSRQHQEVNIFKMEVIN